MSSSSNNSNSAVLSYSMYNCSSNSSNKSTAPELTDFTVIEAILSNRRIIHLSPIHKYAVDIRKVLNIFILKCFVLIKDNWIFTYNC